MADEPQSEDRMTVRERRAQHAKQQARKDAPIRMARKAFVPGLIIILLAAVAVGFYATSKNQEECPGHWHATFAVYVQQDDGSGQAMSFRHPAFDLNGPQAQTPFRAHMHQGDGINQWHFEQGGQCVGVKEAFDYIDVELRADSITFEGKHAELGQAGSYEESGNRTLHAYIESPSGEWREKSMRSVLGYQLKDGEKLLVTYGAFTDVQLQQFKDAMPDPSTGRTEGA